MWSNKAKKIIICAFQDLFRDILPLQNIPTFFGWFIVWTWDMLWKFLEISSFRTLKWSFDTPTSSYREKLKRITSQFWGFYISVHDNLTENLAGKQKANWLSIDNCSFSPFGTIVSQNKIFSVSVILGNLLKLHSRKKTRIQIRGENWKEEGGKKERKKSKKNSFQIQIVLLVLQ